MPLAKVINDLGSFYNAMGERGNRYTSAAVETILDQYSGDEITVFDPITIVGTYHEYDSLYELCDYLGEDADQLILQGLENLQMWTTGHQDEMDMDTLVLHILQHPPIDLKVRYPGACEKWFDWINKSAVGDVAIEDVAVDFLMADWEGYELGQHSDDPKYGIDSAAFRAFRSAFLNRYKYDTADFMSDYIVKLPSWQHDYSRYELLSNGHILCW